MSPPQEPPEIQMSPRVGLILLTLVLAVFWVLTVRVVRRLARERVARLSSTP